MAISFALVCPLGLEVFRANYAVIHIWTSAHTHHPDRAIRSPRKPGVSALVRIPDQHLSARPASAEHTPEPEPARQARCAAHRHPSQHPIHAQRARAVASAEPQEYPLLHTPPPHPDEATWATAAHAAAP
ncbi:hypothetical protein BD413DRAFT_607676 [Trametes elegans]|nr:hypothetical protein BD413DRAFT_607676 [Trametes elegans]